MTMLMILKCPACYQELASGPPNMATAAFLVTIEHVCPLAVPPAPAPDGPAGALSPEEIERLTHGQET